MSALAGIVHAIREEPDCDIHRMVAADWFEENGDPDRAEFVRLQLHRGRLFPGDPLRRRFLDRETQLLEKHQRRWLGPLAGFAGDPPLERGFLTRAVLRSDSQVLDFIRGLPNLFALAPISHLELNDARRDGLHREVMARLADQPAMEWIRGLTIHFPPRLDRARYTSLEPAPHAEALARYLLGSPRWQRLSAFRLDCRDNLNLRTIQLLAQEPPIPCLRRLDLAGCTLDVPGLTYLLASHRFQGLEELVLSGRTEWQQLNFVDGIQSYQAMTPCIGPDGVEALSQLTETSRLRKLDLRWNRLNDRVLDALTASPHLSALQHLRIGEQPLAEWDRHVGAYRRQPRLSPETQARMIARFGSRVQIEPVNVAAT